MLLTQLLAWLPGCQSLSAFEHELKQNRGSSYRNETKNITVHGGLYNQPTSKGPQPFHSCSAGRRWAARLLLGGTSLPWSHRPRPETPWSLAFVLTRSWVVPTLAAARTGPSEPLVSLAGVRRFVDVSSREIN